MPYTPTTRAILCQTIWKLDRQKTNDFVSGERDHTVRTQWKYLLLDCNAKIKFQIPPLSSVFVCGHYMQRESLAGGIKWNYFQPRLPPKCTNCLHTLFQIGNIITHFANSLKGRLCGWTVQTFIFATGHSLYLLFQNFPPVFTPQISLTAMKEILRSPMCGTRSVVLGRLWPADCWL